MTLINEEVSVVDLMVIALYSGLLMAAYLWGLHLPYVGDKWKRSGDKWGRSGEKVRALGEGRGEGKGKGGRGLEEYCIKSSASFLLAYACI